MHAISNRGLLLAFLLIGITGLTFLVPRADAAPSFDTGIVDADAFDHGSDEAFKHAADSGARYVKNNLYWSFIAPDGESAQRPGTDVQPFDATDPASPYYQWATFDRIVRKADAQGLETIFSVASTPRWARISACADTGICSPHPADYADFATAAAKRYSGTFDPGDGEGVLPRVRFWQAWVEPNLYLFYKPIFKPNGAPDAPYRYRTILNAFYDAVHAVDDSNTVIAAGLAPNSVRGKAIAPLDFTRRALCLNGNYKKPRRVRGCNFQVKADVWAVHPYTTGAPIHVPHKADSMSVSTLSRMQNLLRVANQTNRLVRNNGRRTQLWVTEFSWDSRPPDPGGLPWGLQSRWVAQAMYMMYKANVRTMIWFGLRDSARSAGQSWADTFESGLYLRRNTVANDKPKQVLRVFRMPFYAEKTGRGFKYWGRTPDSKRATIQLFGRRKGSGRYVRVGTARANVNGIFQGNLRRRGFTRNGAVYAKVPGGQASVSFGLWKTRDCRQPPFGAKRFNRACLKRG